MKKRNVRYNTNKAAKVGTEIICPVCGKHFIKKYYQQAFCSTECKDKYWNQKRKGNGYFKQYNKDHPERLERIGIDLDYEDDCLYALGDPENESLAQITLDKSCYDDFYDGYYDEY
jgi:predicted nucleic acid-binding Zn ribbon protein